MNRRLNFLLGDYDPVTRSVVVIASTPAPVDGVSIRSFDLERFLKNPVVLWNHDSTIPAIGRAADVAQGPQGLGMRIIFAHDAAKPCGADIESLVAQKVITAVSVQFGPGLQKQEVVGTGIVTFLEDVELLETSFVNIPADEDAGTPALNPAASSFDAADTRSDAFTVDATLSKVEWTPFGAARIKARFARIGVLEYPSRGTSEYNPPEVLFHADALASLKGVPVIDIRDHTGFITPEDFKGKTLGHIEEGHVDGDFIEGTILVNDAGAIEDLRAGRRLDVSMGYYAPTEPAEGEFRGQKYNRVRKSITFNHVALCPPGTGRAGTDVGLRLDSKENDDMKIIINGKEYEFGSQAHFDALEAISAGKLAAKDKEIADLQKANATLQGKFDAEVAASTKAKEEAAATEKKSAEDKKASEESFAKKMSNRMRFLKRALRLFGEEEEGEEPEEADKKMDARIDEWSRMSDRDVQVAIIKKHNPDFKLPEGKLDGYLDAFVEATFDSLEADKKKASGVDNVVRVAEETKRQLDARDRDNGQDGPEEKARKAMEERRRNAWKQQPGGAAGNGGK